MPKLSPRMREILEGAIREQPWPDDLDGVLYAELAAAGMRPAEWVELRDAFSCWRPADWDLFLNEEENPESDLLSDLRDAVRSLRSYPYEMIARGVAELPSVIAVIATPAGVHIMQRAPDDDRTKTTFVPFEEAS